MTASIWAPGSTNVPSVDPASQLVSETFTATEGQTDFVITQFTYSINSGALTVFVNRAKLDHQYVTDLTTTSFRIPACEVGDSVEVVGNVAIDDPSLYADAAAASAAEALGYKNAASGSASSAAASAAAAAASYDNFDDRYLGTKSTAPTLDNDGNPLVTGALYYNDGTVVLSKKGMWVYTGIEWIPASAASQAILTVYKFTATAGQTTFSGSDDESKTLTYTPGSAIVTVNGVVLEIPSEVAASTGTTIVLVNAASVNDELNVYAFATFDVANTYTQSAADALLATKVAKSGSTMTGQLVLQNSALDLQSGQIKFPATQSASSDANTLDDYEEGTFTLTWWSVAGGTGTNLGQSTTNNRYVKIGKAVTIIFDRAGIGSGTCASFTGLPFIPIAAASTISSDSCVMYWDSTYPTAMSYRTADGIYSRGTLTYQTA